MLIRQPPSQPILPSEITPEAVYRDRRRFLAGLGLGTLGLLTAACGKAEDKAAPATAGPAANPALDKQPSLPVTRHTDFAGGEVVTPSTTATTYNNFYEFGTNKDEPAYQAFRLKKGPWTVTVDGECEAPGRIDLDELIKPYALEERVYRHRCVEGWSIVVPWVGFPLADLLKRFKPTSKAKFVSFFSLFDAGEMPYAGNVLPWPYREGLRIDEAMHPLAFLSVGMYGKVLPNQNGAPLRLTIPWKYGFKSIKSIVHIKFKEEMPETTWNFVGPEEYGFYSNVNPEVDHPRWSQKTERRLGELFKRKTLMFNGYPEVASLYAGMDLRRNF